MLKVHTGENRLLSGALVARVGAALDAALEAAANPKRKSAGGSGIWAAQKY